MCVRTHANYNRYEKKFGIGIGGNNGFCIVLHKE